MKLDDSDNTSESAKSPISPTSTDTNTSFKKELEQILKGYHDRLLMTETAYDIKQRNTALTSIINLVDKEVIGEDDEEEIKHEGMPDRLSDVNFDRNILREEQRTQLQLIKERIK